MNQQALSVLKKANGIILHLGAGECHELETYLQTPAEQIVLVEPDPETAQMLRLRTKSEGRVKVIEAAVSRQGGKATLHRYSLNGLATLHPLKKAPLRWPGLREVDRLEVQTMGLSELLEQLVLDESKANWVVLDAPGEEVELLEAIGHYIPAQPFAYVSLFIGALTPRVEQTWPKLYEALGRSGYRLEEVDSQKDVRVYHAQVDPLWKINHQIKSELAASEQQKKQAHEQEEQATKAAAASTRKLGDCERKLKESRQQLSELQLEHLRLQQDNQKYEEKHSQLRGELFNAEAQIEMLKELLLNTGLKASSNGDDT